MNSVVAEKKFIQERLGINYENLSQSYLRAETVLTNLSTYQFYLQRAGVTGMGEVLMGEVSAEPVPLMGASDIFTAPSNDFTAGGAGEMDY